MWTTTDFASWASTVVDTRTSAFHEAILAGKCFDECILTFVSYPVGGDASADGVPMRAKLDRNTLALTSGPSDMRVLISGLPSGQIATVLQLGGQELGYLQVELEKKAMITSFGFLGGTQARGTAQPHAAIGTAAGPVGVPAASTWGLVVLSLCLGVVGTILLARDAR